ncbi:DUF6232 family protein [Streptomyces graminilatus]|uniref:DUF6232 family protein n=1 Tax=Streptomyces graminilatus TaxID=1464070 RepID=UPI0012FEFDD1|nr:DUF6232 family protein [Streptomyces graminilatus]
MSRSVNIKISQRILSVGDSSFPMHNISSTQIVEPEFKFPQVLAAGLSAVAGLIFFTMTRNTRSSAVMGGPPEFVREHAYTVDLPTTICTAVAAILLPIGICQVARRLYVRSTVRILVIVSAGLSGVAIASRNLAQLRKISLEITSAINNPLADFQITIEKFHLGDNISINGPNGTAIRVMK